MKRIISIIICLILLSTLELSAQPKSINYKKEHDFFVLVVGNPNHSIGDFLCYGVRSSNTELRSFEFYSNNKYCQKLCNEAGINMRTAYDKILACWKVLLIIEDQDWFPAYHDWDPYDTMRPRSIDPVLKHRVSIVPLKLEEY